MHAFMIILLLSYQRHLATLPVVYTQDAAVEKSIMRRRRNTLKTMDDMDVLDYMPGKADKKIEINDD